MPSDDVLHDFHPLIAEWFRGRFPNGPTDAQQDAWPHIRAGRDTLVAAPTGSGKTLTAFLAGIDRFVREAERGELKPELRILYISPLKALANDIQRNLDGPLAELMVLARQRGKLVPEIVTAVRTGDTEQEDREEMRLAPAHILNTTPESLSVMLTDHRDRDLLCTVDTVIVDEIHALAQSKRGSLLSLAMARLDAVAHGRPQRIGLSATQKPMDEIGGFLSGIGSDGRLIRTILVDQGHVRKRDLAIEIKGRRANSLIRQHQQTLEFVNQRSGAEGRAAKLSEAIGEDKVGVHHGSLSKEQRVPVEQQLQSGNLKVVAATASLELGIDIGEIDLVIQYRSPGNIATFLQRVGRAGHSLGSIPKCRLFSGGPRPNDDLIECAAIMLGVNEEALESLTQPVAPLDVLAQQIAAEVLARPATPDELYRIFRRAYPYRDLTRDDFNQVVRYALSGLDSGQGFPFGRTLDHDGRSGFLYPTPMARKSAKRNVGTIPDDGEYAVIEGGRSYGTRPSQPVGDLDPDYVGWLTGTASQGDGQFRMANKTWELERVDHDALIVWVRRVSVEAKIPWWITDGGGRSRIVSQNVSRLRRHIVAKNLGFTALAVWLEEHCNIKVVAARRMIQYITASSDILGIVPSDRDVVIERITDSPKGSVSDDAGSFEFESRDMIVFHAPFGSRITRAWSLAIAQRLRKLIPETSSTLFTQEGFAFVDLPAGDEVPIEAFRDLTPSTVEATVSQAVVNSEIFHRRWRWSATIAQAVHRIGDRGKIPVSRQRIIAEDLLDRLYPATRLNREVRAFGECPEHPILNQAIQDCLFDSLDLRGLRAVLQHIEEGRIRVHYVKTKKPSPMAESMLGMANDEDEEEEEEEQSANLPRR